MTADERLQTIQAIPGIQVANAQITEDYRARCIRVQMTALVATTDADRQLANVLVGCDRYSVERQVNLMGEHLRVNVQYEYEMPYDMWAKWYAKQEER